MTRTSVALLAVLSAGTAAAHEGHGFAKKENQDYLFWNSLMFWDQTLLK